MSASADLASLGLGSQESRSGLGNAPKAGLALRTREEAAGDVGAAVAEFLRFHDLRYALSR